MRRKYKRLAIYLDYGRKGSGKSLTQARTALHLFKDYRKIEKRWRNLPKRILFTNVKLSAEIEQKEYGTHLFYWDNFRQLRWCPRVDCWRGKENHPIHDADIQHDEIGKDFPAGCWATTPKWVKQIFSHLRKRGNRYFANTQVYEDIDIAFRRQIDFACKIVKVFGSGDITATKPPIRFVYGLILKTEFDPELLEWERDPEKRKIKSRPGLPEAIWIKKKWINAFDTTKEIPPYQPDTLEHFELWCEKPDCPVHGKHHDKGKPKYLHTTV